MIQIREPIWKKPRSIGIAESKLQQITNIEIIYRTKDGIRLYPYPFSITKEKALTYPIQFVQGINLRIIPIDHLFEEK